MITWKWKLVKQGGWDRRVKQGGSRDEWREVGNGMEIIWRWVGEGDQRCNGEGVEWNGVVRDPLVIWYLTRDPVLLLAGCSP